MENESWVKVFSTNEMYQLEVVKDKLKKNEIPTHIIDKHDSAFVVLSEAEVYVHQNQLDKAKELLATS